MRPTTFDEIIGQEEAKTKCKILIDSYSKKNEAIPHILFVGGSGTGKTTMARVISNECGRRFTFINGNSLQTSGDVNYYLGQIVEQEIIFIDEIHGMNKKAAESLLTAVEDFEYNEGGMVKEIPKFTLIGATTHSGKLPRALLQRFPHIQELKEYTDEELASLVNIKANEGTGLKIHFPEELALVIAKTCRGNPRLIINRTEWVKDYMISNDLKKMSKQDALKVIRMQGYDEHGLTDRDRKYIEVLSNYRTLGLRELSNKTNIAQETILNEIEPYLSKLGLVISGSKGRRLDMRKYKEYGYDIKEESCLED